MSRRPLRELARRFERRCLRPLLQRSPWRRWANGRAAAAARIESRLEQLERLLQEVIGLQYLALSTAGDSHRLEEPPCRAHASGQDLGSGDASRRPHDLRLTT
jgi:hypothetical protein